MTNQRYVSEALCVFSFERNKQVRHKTSEVEQNFGGLIDAQSILSNLPDDFDPKAPRIVLRKKNKTIFLSQVHIQLTLQFEPGSKPLSEQLPILRKNFEEFEQRAEAFLGEAPVEIGLVCGISSPSVKSKEVLGEEMYEKFYKVPAQGKIVSCEAKFGFLTQNNVFANFHFSVYELFQGQLLQPNWTPMGVGAIMGETDPNALEVGTEKKVDINSRPMGKKTLKNSRNGFEEMLSLLEYVIRDDETYSMDIGEQKNA